MQVFLSLTENQILKLKAILEKPDNKLTIQDARNLKRMTKTAIVNLKV